MIKLEFLDKGDSTVCEKTLRSLPDWFGVESAIVDYVNTSKKFPMITAQIDNEIAGFLSIKKHSAFSAEVYVMGVLPEFQNKGVGTALLDKAESLLSESNIEFVQVKTVSEDREDVFYERTRSFYKRYGFREIEVFPTLWDKSNPCLLLLKSIKKV